MKFLGRVNTLSQISPYGLNTLDVRAQNVPTYRFVSNLPRRKVATTFAQKAKMGGEGGGGVTDFVLERICPEK